MPYSSIKQNIICLFWKIENKTIRILGISIEEISRGERMVYVLDVYLLMNGTGTQALAINTVLNWILAQYRKRATQADEYNSLNNFAGETIWNQIINLVKKCTEKHFKWIKIERFHLNMLWIIVIIY